MAWKFYLIFIPWVAIEFIVVYFVYLENKGYSLEEIALLSDGEDTIPFEDHYLANEKEVGVEHYVFIKKYFHCFECKFYYEGFVQIFGMFHS
jgi:hypothetical protein